MKLKIKCDCGGKIVSHSQSPTPMWFCDNCTKKYELEDLRLPEEVVEKRPPILECEHFFKCITCGAESED